MAALTPNVVAGIKESWPKAAADAAGFGEAWFTSAFSKDASLKTLFGGADANSAKMNTHVSKILEEVAKAVGSIDKPADMTANLNKIKNGHKGIAIDKVKHKNAMCDALVETVSSKCGAQYAAAWKAFGDRLIDDVLINV